MNLELLIKETLGPEYELIEGECVLIDSDEKHYLTIKEINNNVVFLYPIAYGFKAIDTVTDSMIINGHPDFIGKSSLFLACRDETLVLSVFGKPVTKNDFENLRDDAENLRAKVVTHLENKRY